MKHNNTGLFSIDCNGHDECRDRKRHCINIINISKPLQNLAKKQGKPTHRKQRTRLIKTMEGGGYMKYCPTLHRNIILKKVIRQQLGQIESAKIVMS